MAEGDTQTAPVTDGTAAAAASEAAQTPQQADAGGADDQQQQAEPEQPAGLTPEQIEERTFQRVASWMGRREKESRDAILQNVSQLLEQRLPRQQEPQPTLDRKIDTAEFLEKPTEVLSQILRSEVPRIINEHQRQQTKAEQEFNAELIRHAGGMMDSDTLFSGKDGQELGNAVVQEVIRNAGSVDRKLPPNLAARLLVNDAVTNIVRKRSGTKQNAFAGRIPQSGGTGTVKAPAINTQKAKTIKLSEAAEGLRKRFGYKQEDLAKIFGE